MRQALAQINGPYCSGRPHAVVPAVPSCPGRAQQRQHRQQTIVCGILDSYRREKGLPVPEQHQTPQQQSHNGTATLANRNGNGKGSRSNSNSSTHISLDPTDSPTLTQLLLDDTDGLHFSDSDTPCPVECVEEIFTVTELEAVFESAGPSGLVVVDFYKSSCGACKFIYQGFVKLCKASNAGHHEHTPPVVFIKHNVYNDDEEEVTDLCRTYNVKNVPKFILFKGGKEVDSFATRDKTRVAEAVLKHAEPGSVEFYDWQ